MRASNIAYETPEGRPFWKLRPLQVLVDAGDGLCCSQLLALSLVLTGPVVDQVAGPLGVSDAAHDRVGHRQVAGDGWSSCC